MIRFVTTHILAAYIGAGLFGGFVMQSAVPAMNLFGVAAYGVTWPAFLYCARTNLDKCDPFGHIPIRVQSMMFDLEAGQ